MRGSTHHTLTLQFLPNRAWLMLGPGWAVLAGVLASGGLRLEAAVLLKVAALWFLADPILGTLWRLLVDQGLGRTLRRTDPPLRILPKPGLPYVRKGSAGYRWAVFWAHLRALEDGRGYTLLIAILLAIFMAAILGRPVVLLAGFSILLAFVLGETADGRGKRFWQGLATFLLPYLAGLIVMAEPAPVAVALGCAYWVIYLGVLGLMAGRPAGETWVILGQSAAALLLFGSRMPLGGATVALATLFSLLLRLAAKRGIAQPEIWYAGQLKPYLLAGLFAAAASLGGG